VLPNATERSTKRSAFIGHTSKPGKQSSQQTPNRRSMNTGFKYLTGLVVFALAIVVVTAISHSSHIEFWINKNQIEQAPVLLIKPPQNDDESVYFRNQFAGFSLLLKSGNATVFKETNSHIIIEDEGCVIHVTKPFAHFNPYDDDISGDFISVTRRIYSVDINDFSFTMNRSELKEFRFLLGHNSLEFGDVDCVYEIDTTKFRGNLIFFKRVNSPKFVWVSRDEKLQGILNFQDPDPNDVDFIISCCKSFELED